MAVTPGKVLAFVGAIIFALVAAGIAHAGALALLPAGLFFLALSLVV